MKIQLKSITVTSFFFSSSQALYDSHSSHLQHHRHPAQPQQEELRSLYPRQLRLSPEMPQASP